MYFNDVPQRPYFGPRVKVASELVRSSGFLLPFKPFRQGTRYSALYKMPVNL